MYNYSKKQIGDHWYVIAKGNGSEGLKIAKIPHHLKHPRAVATAISESLNSNKKLILVDLI